MIFGLAFGGAVAPNQRSALMDILRGAAERIFFLSFCVFRASSLVEASMFCSSPDAFLLWLGERCTSGKRRDFGASARKMYQYQDFF